MKWLPRKRSLATPVIGIITLVLVSLIAYAKLHHQASTTSKSTDTQSVASVQKQEDSETAKQPAIHVDSELQSVVDAWAAQQSSNVAITVQELDGDLRGASYHANVQMVTASTYKIYVAYAILHEVEQGTYTMGTVTRSGQTVSAALNKMIQQSDNASAEALGFLVGWDRINSLAAAAGTTNTDINNYNSAEQPVDGNKLSTADDLMTTISKLQQGKLLNAANTTLLLDLMKTQVWRQRIPAGVPQGVEVADKPGWLFADNSGTPNVQNDAAIVYGPHSTYALVIMTDGNGTGALADLSRQIYAYLQI